MTTATPAVQVGESGPGAGGGRLARAAAGLALVGSQTVAGLRMNRARTAAAWAGLVVGTAVLTAGWHAGTPDAGLWWAGSVLLAIVAAATATASDPRQLRASAVLDLLGATRRQRRQVVVVEAALLGLLAFPVGWAIGAVVAGIADTELPAAAAVFWSSLLIPAGVALFAGRIRTRVTVIDARGGRGPAATGARKGALRRTLRIGFAVLCLLGGYLLAARSTSWSDLDFSLGPSIVLVGLALSLLVPLVLDGLVAALGRASSITANLAGALLRARRPLVLPAMLLGTIGGLAVAVHAMLGAGLVEREQQRRSVVEARYTFTAGMSDQELVAGRVNDGLSTSLPFVGDYEFWSEIWGGFDPEAVERLRIRWPAATVAEVAFVPAAVIGDPLVGVPGGRKVAVGTPELLRSLGLEDLVDELAAGRSVVLDASAMTTRGTVAVRWTESTSWAQVAPGADDPTAEDGVRMTSVTGHMTAVGDPEGRAERLPAVLANPGRVPLSLPAVLVPASRVPTDPADHADVPRTPNAVVVRLDRPPTGDDRADLRTILDSGSDLDSHESAFPVDVWAGGDRVRPPYREARLDASEAVGLREPGEVRLAVATVAVVAVVGLLVALRLATVTRRSDEDVVELVGARPARLRRLAAVQAVVLAGLATSLGLAVGIGLTRLGLAEYNTQGRLGSGPGDTDLPPIPVIVPSALLVGLLLAPLVAAAVAWLLALRRPTPDPATVADGLLW